MGVALVIGVALAAGLLAWVLGTERGTAWTVEQAITRYSASIPGTITIDGLHGHLGDRVCLVGVAVSDAEERPLVAMRELCVKARPWALLGGTLEVERLDATGVRVHLWPDSSWGDLAPPSAPSPSAAPGPDLPLAIEAYVEVFDVTVEEHPPGPSLSELLIRDAELRARLTGRGRHAALEIERVAGEIGPVDDLRVTSGRGRITWRSPVVSVDDLWLESEAGEVLLPKGRLDVLARRYAAALLVRLFESPLEEVALPSAELELRGEGTWTGATATLQADVPAYGSARIHAAAEFRAGRPLRARVRGDVDPSLDLGLPDAHVEASARLEDGRLEAHARVNVPDADASAWLHGDAEGMRARAEARVPGARLEVSAELPDRALSRVEAHVVVRSAEAATAYVDRLSSRDVPRLAGVGRIDARCRRSGDWRCHVSARARHEDDRLSLEGEVATGEVLAVTLRRLEGELRDQPVLLRGLASMTIDDDGATVDELGLAVAGGHLGVKGRVAWKGRSNLEVDVDHIDLGVVEHLVPSLPIRGRLDGRMRLRGTAGRPTLRVDLGASSLGWADEPLGRVRLDARYDQELAEAEVRWSHRRARARVFGRVPMHVALDGSPFGLVASRPLLASVDVEGFELRRLAPWLPIDEAPRGRADATVRLAGRLDDPVMLARISVDGAGMGERPWGDARLTMLYEDERARVDLRLAGPRIGRGHVAMLVPLRVDPLAGRVVPRLDAPHRLVAELHGFELAVVDPWVPGLELDGIAGARLDLAAHQGVLRGEGLVRGRRLRWAGVELGAAEVRLHLLEDDARARVHLSGPWARLVEVSGRLPIRSRRSRGPGATWAAPEWDPQRPIEATLELEDVRLAGLRHVLPELAMAGTLAGSVRLDGTGAAPRLSAALTADHLSVQSSPLGRVRLRARYDGADGLRARLEQRHGAQRIEASARVPLHVDGSSAAVQWHREQEHALSVRAAGVDQRMLAGLLALPRGLELMANAALELRGPALSPSGVLRARMSAWKQELAPVSVSLQASIAPEQQHARLLIDGGPRGLTVTARLDAALRELLTGTLEPSEVVIDAKADVEGLALARLAPLLPSSVDRPEGSMSLHASVEGRLSNPRLEGRLQIERAAVTIVPLQQRLTELNVEAALSGPDVALEMSARSGDGSTRASGSLHVARGESRGSMQLVADALPIVRPGLPMMTLGARVDVDMDATGELTRIDVVARNGFVDVLETTGGRTAKQIPDDEGIVFTDRAGREAQQEAHDQQTWIPRDLEVTLTLADPLRIRASQADMDWRGRVTVRNEQGQPPRVHGSFQTVGGRVSLLGNDFDIQRAVVRMPVQGDLDPFIDLVATTRIEDIGVTMAIDGPLSRPRLELRSDPSMPESDVFALLITGRADANETDDAEYGAKVASVLAAFENSALQRQLRQTVGIDRVAVGFGETVDQPILTVGKRINRRLYVEGTYHHNAPAGTNRAELSLDYRFAPPHWSVETFFGDAGQGGAGLWWSRRFGGTQGKPR